MKIEISGGGYLLIERAGRMKSQECCNNSLELCGDWCPQFGEPMPSELYKDKEMLVLCNDATWYCDEIIDLRAREV